MKNFKSVLTSMGINGFCDLIGLVPQCPNQVVTAAYIVKEKPETVFIILEAGLVATSADVNGSINAMKTEDGYFVAYHMIHFRTVSEIKTKNPVKFLSYICKVIKHNKPK